MRRYSPALPDIQDAMSGPQNSLLHSNTGLGRRAFRLAGPLRLA